MSTVAKAARVRKPKATEAPVVSLCLAISHTCYSVRPIPAGEFGTKALRLEKQSGDRETYDLLRDNDGRLECTCPDFECRHRGHGTLCKHLFAATCLGLLDPPATTPAPAPEPEPPAPSRPGIDRVRDEFDAPACEVCGAAISPEAAAAWGVCQRCYDDARAAAEAPAPGASDGFADEMHAAVGLPPVEPPAGEEPEPEPDPLAEWVRPARRNVLLPIAPASPRPVRPAPLPPGRYTLTELVEGQAALLRGQGGPVWDLMASALDRLAADIRATGATCVAEFQDRLASMEADRLERLQYDAFAAGFCQAEAQAAAECR